MRVYGPVVVSNQRKGLMIKKQFQTTEARLKKGYKNIKKITNDQTPD